MTENNLDITQYNVNTLPLIAFTGKARSGKSYAATYLAINYGLSRVSFASTLKQAAYDLFISVGYGSGDRKDRDLYNKFGQGMREIYSDVWIAHTARNCRMDLDRLSCKGIVNDDLRQQNEYDWLRDNGFYIVRVEASDDVRRARAIAAGDGDVELTVTNPLDVMVDEFDVDATIVNDSHDIDALNGKLDTLAKSLGLVKITDK